MPRCRWSMLAVLLAAGCARSASGPQSSPASGPQSRTEACARLNAALDPYLAETSHAFDVPNSAAGEVRLSSQLSRASQRFAAEVDGSGIREPKVLELSQQLTDILEQRAGTSREVARHVSRWSAQLERAVFAAAEQVGRFERECATPKSATTPCPELVLLGSNLTGAKPKTIAEHRPTLAEARLSGDAAQRERASLLGQLDRLAQAQEQLALSSYDETLAKKLRGSADTLISKLEQAKKLCGEVPPAPTKRSEWVAADKIDPRKLTVLVAARPPAGVLAMLRLGAESAEDRDFMEAVSEGRNGSGALIALRGKGGQLEHFVVTNRHVVEMAEGVEVSLSDGTQLPRAEVLFTDAQHDLAVLRLAADKGLTTGGYVAALAPAKDQQEVVATGFPGLGSRPSYQITQGYVSNSSVVFDEVGYPSEYIQHTAPIDPGNSGGPLTTKNGQLLGINSAKVDQRENVAFAIPVGAVARTVERARHNTDESTRGAAREACLELVTELQRDEVRVQSLERWVSPELVGGHGMTSYVYFENDEEMKEHLDAVLAEDFLDGLRYAVLKRMYAEFTALGGIHPIEVCRRIEGNDERVSVQLQLRRGQRKLSFRRAHGRMKLSDVEFRSTPLPVER